MPSEDFQAHEDFELKADDFGKRFQSERGSKLTSRKLRKLNEDVLSVAGPSK